jgi:hypothetical protein
MYNDNKELKKGDVVLLVAYGKVWKTTITRKERNSDHYVHTDMFHSQNVSNIFPYNESGLLSARNSLLNGLKNDILHHQEQIRKAEEALERPIILRIDRPGPTEKTAYFIDEAGKLVTKIDQKEVQYSVDIAE